LVSASVALKLTANALGYSSKSSRNSGSSFRSVEQAKKKKKKRKWEGESDSVEKME